MDTTFPTRDEKVIDFNKVDIYQGESLILHNVNFAIDYGEFIYLIGKTGSGKSSLLKTIYADLHLHSGSAFVCGFNLAEANWKNIPYLRRKLGIVFQDFQLLMDRNVEENLEFVLRATGTSDKALIKIKIDEALRRVGLQTKGFKMPYELSGGEQQRVVIARAIINDPEIVIADEPTGNLDPDTSEDIMQLLIYLNKEYNTAILMATHNYGILDKYPSKILQCANGSINEITSTASIE
ncbi:MAG: ATP-binding cassette domain-containing protein [Bacteroidetes bacterium]|nr:ATP-binding cassette domain-containing protein [Bacteroidota bacterium]MBP7398088.1 ATP-binding cassette domain-containing protein [Chitinophagales bacterium]MBK8487945.1 ATP-binding cassette domain-containing protein [Bacteroidota bacterium]MBP8754279.1 ATP-binding cassette domain-containing protein [Chitinophagales bacterium]MBP9188146.1 ATP-binding cassette domain-containing protein [Chitinophagales bacterium]